MSDNRKKIEVKLIAGAEKLADTDPFYVEELLWGTKEIPRTYGYIGFVPQDGFYIKLVCEEKNPLRRYTKVNEPIYRDSALEAFFLFNSGREKTEGDLYLNFEMNANGAMLAAYGKERNCRSFFSEEEQESFCCRADLQDESWSVSFHLPAAVLERIYGPLNLERGSHFTCNFYKISEDKEIEHYASFTQIESLTPCFHMPSFFAEAKIV